jgi:hypothetical protein
LGIARRLVMRALCCGGGGGLVALVGFRGKWVDLSDQVRP